MRKNHFARHHGHRGHHAHHGHHEGREGGFGRLLAHGDLRYVILSLLEERPRHGYELIKALEEISHGTYSPSPGTIYPTLSFLEEGGYASAQTESNKKLFTITDEGRALLAENKDFLITLLRRISAVGEKRSKFRHWMGRDEAEDIAKAEKSPIRKAMHGLKAEIFAFMEETKEKKQRVSEIIDRAAAEIRQLRGNG